MTENSLTIDTYRSGEDAAFDNVPGYSEPTDYKFSVNIGRHGSNVTANPRL
ncbi:hypothetical protein [Sporosarcina globispora]|uniref:hypothetical protein n=1 Tax=Sporosarcina globispora TaxID=1459 RepID=UPI000A58B7EF|nr:hypothetical protein [Sporosarcina globispora]